MAAASADERDIAHLDEQRNRYCRAPRFPLGPDAYHYVPARCVANRRRTAAPPLPATLPLPASSRCKALWMQELAALNGLAVDLLGQARASTRKGCDATPTVHRALFTSAIGYLPRLQAAFVAHLLQRCRGRASDTFASSSFAGAVDALLKADTKKRTAVPQRCQRELRILLARTLYATGSALLNVQGA